MKRHQKTIALFLFVTALLGCTDRRIPFTKVPVKINSSLPPQSLIEVADVKYDQKDTTVWTMVNKGDSIFLTGAPFGFARWEIGPNPENPQLTFAVATQIDLLKPRWIAPLYASGALAVLGSYAFMSGTAGASVMDMRNTGSAKEALRYPPYDENATQNSADDAFIWSAASFHPSRSVLYAFRQQDYVVTYTFDSSGLHLRSKDFYGGAGSTVCCVNASTVFNSSVYVAFRSRLVFFDFGGDLSLTNGREYEGLQANYVTSTARYLYVSHEPTTAASSSSVVYPAGIYVFDKQGNNVAYLPAHPKMFVVNDADTHVYANEDDMSVKIYRIQWTR